MEHREKARKGFQGFMWAVCLIALGMLAYVLFARSLSANGARAGNGPTPSACSNCPKIGTCETSEMDGE
jgi:hypothetical protein